MILYRLVIINQGPPHEVYSRKTFLFSTLRQEGNLYDGSESFIKINIVIKIRGQILRIPIPKLKKIT